MQEDNICELEMRLSAKQAELDSIHERLTNSDIMVRQNISFSVQCKSEYIVRVCTDVLSLLLCLI